MKKNAANKQRMQEKRETCKETGGRAKGCLPQLAIAGEFGRIWELPHYCYLLQSWDV